MRTTIQSAILSTLILFTSGCLLFKESDLDPNGDLTSLLMLQKLLVINNATAPGVALGLTLKFQQANGATYADSLIKYGKPSTTSLITRSTSVSELTQGTDETVTIVNSKGEASLKFTSPGYAKVEIYSTLADVSPKATITFKVFSTLDSSNFRILSQSGDIVATFQRLSVSYSTPVSLESTLFQPLGAKEGRFYVCLKQANAEKKIDTYIASSSDGFTYDRITKISDLQGVDPVSPSTDQTTITLGAPGYDGTDILFFIRKDTTVSSVTTTLNYYVKLSPTSPAKTVTAVLMPAINVSPAAILVSPASIPDNIYYSGRWIIFELVGGVTKAYARNLEGTVATDLSSTCLSGSTVQANVFYVYSSFLLCGITAYSTPSPSYNYYQSNFSAGSPYGVVGGASTQSAIFPIGGGRLGIMEGTVTSYGYAMSNSVNIGIGSLSFGAAVSGLTYSPTSAGAFNYITKVISSEATYGVIAQDGSNYVVFYAKDGGTSYTKVTATPSSIYIGIPSEAYQSAGGEIFLANYVSGSNLLGGYITKINSSGNWTDPVKGTYFQSNQ
ncbi:hypothetical protein [Leptospira ilyithenensis]|uniref:Uncharacterized protein n=1 Tax=Leptospira ilyithenensis TaxID=2484901 RepID=A0A4R9LLY4_9LEPT|nr:hypothetical protein [Leptospira ilyithenensis]TGN07184.1 hypothetical protein EHS11_18960 [Leptospira ilyithenensis]